MTRGGQDLPVRVSGPGGAFLWNRRKNLGVTVREVLLWMGAVFWNPSPSPLAPSSYCWGRGPANYTSQSPLPAGVLLGSALGGAGRTGRREEGRAFLVFPAEGPGSLSHVAAALAATAAGDSGSGSSFQPWSLQWLWLQVPCHTIFPLFLQPEGGSGFLQLLLFVINSL